MDFRNYQPSDWLKLLGGLVILALVWWVFPQFQGTDSTTPQSQDSTHSSSTRSARQSSQEATSSADVKAFTGTNYQVLPKQVKIPVRFVRVVDGDTVILSLNGHEFRTRYLMIDTPESVKEGVAAQPYGKEAAKRNENLLKQAKQVTLEFDKGPYADDYDRALAYVYADDQLVSLTLVKEGLASVSYVNPPNNSQEKILRQAQQEAKAAKRAIWSIPNYVNDKGKFTIQE